MKKIFAGIMACFLTIGCVSCAQTPNDGERNSGSSSSALPEENSSSSSSETTEITPPEALEMDWRDDGVLKILTIGNSFSDDSMEYVYQIAKSAGVEEVKLGNLFIGGCSLATHAQNARADAEAYTYHTNNSGTWNTRSSHKMSDAILSENWDYISLQQASGSSGMTRTYGRALKYMVNYVKGLMSANTKLVWNMTWAYQQNSTHAEFVNYGRDQMRMYESIVNAVQDQVWAQDDIKAVIPTGTAIQNARTSFIGDALTRDGFHLSLDLGRYIAGLTFVRCLTGLSIDGVEFAPSGVTAEEKAVAIESANNATACPYTVTKSIY